MPLLAMAPLTVYHHHNKNYIFRDIVLKHKEQTFKAQIISSRKNLVGNVHDTFKTKKHKDVKIPRFTSPFPNYQHLSQI